MAMLDPKLPLALKMYNEGLLFLQNVVLTSKCERAHACASSAHPHGLLRMRSSHGLHPGGWAEPPTVAASGSPNLERTS